MTQRVPAGSACLEEGPLRSEVVGRVRARKGDHRDLARLVACLGLPENITEVLGTAREVVGVELAFQLGAGLGRWEAVGVELAFLELVDALVAEVLGGGGAASGSRG